MVSGRLIFRMMTRHGFSLLELIVVLILLALVATAAWLPVRDVISGASEQRFVSQMISGDFQERIASRSNPSGGSLRTSRNDKSLHWSASSRSVKVPDRIQNVNVSVRDARSGTWQTVEAVQYVGSGQSPTYRIDWINANGKSGRLVVLGISGQAITHRGGS